MPDNSEVSPLFWDWRNMMLSLSPEELGITPENFPYPVFGLLMETGMPEGVFLLACLANGTTSLYLSDGSGTIGGGHYAEVQSATEYLLAGAQHYYDQATPVSAFPLTNTGMTRFYFLTTENVFAYQELDEELYEGRDQLSKLFYAAHAVLAAISKVESQVEGS